MFQTEKSNYMDCGVCIGKIDDYREGKLSNDDKLSIESHLQTCPDCLQMLRIQGMADRIISEEKKIVPDFYLTGRIMQKIGKLERKPTPVFIRILRPALATIAVAAAIMAGVMIGDLSSVTDKGAPVELTLMNDADIEMITVLSAE